MKFIYIASYTGIKTLIEALLEKYTNLIKYVNWQWYWSFMFYKWYFKEELHSPHAKTNPSY